MSRDNQILDSMFWNTFSHTVRYWKQNLALHCIKKCIFVLVLKLDLMFWNAYSHTVRYWKQNLALHCIKKMHSSQLVKWVTLKESHTCKEGTKHMSGNRVMHLWQERLNHASKIKQDENRINSNIIIFLYSNRFEISKDKKIMNCRSSNLCRTN